jgi:ribonucleotide reductase alpha subunit
MKQSCKIAKERKEIMLRNYENYKTGQIHFAKNDMWCDNIIVPKTCPKDDIIRNDLKKIKIIKMEYDVNEKYLGAYQSFEGSPLSQGKFQFDLWGKQASKRYNWDELRKDIIENGVRNSLAIALMPTASTSQILGNNECIEPYTSNIYSRRTIAGDFVVVNKHLIKKCNELGIWTKEIKDKVIAYNGSVQYIDEIPDKIKKLFRTAWELKQKSIMELAISRGPYVCQTQSMNLFFEEPTYKTLTGALFYAWREGLKTGVYYVRSRPKIQAQQFTLDPDFIKKLKAQEQKTFEVCESCSA